MDAEVIFEKPLSGEFEEVLFGSASGNTLWVRFLTHWELPSGSENSIAG